MKITTLNEKTYSKPMIKKYPKTSPDMGVTPSEALINQILNYSKSVEVKKTKHQKVLVQLN